jgi:hypothetical protein
MWWLVITVAKPNIVKDTMCNKNTIAKTQEKKVILILIPNHAATTFNFRFKIIIKYIIGNYLYVQKVW